MARRSRELRRRPPRRVERSRILIVTEGTETEIQYLEGLKQYLGALGATVRGTKMKGIGKDPKRVLAAALDIIERDLGGFEEAWLVVDVDDHSVLTEALRMAAKAGIPMVVSNPCFEIWLLWHYQDCAAHQSHDQLKAKLAKHGHHGKNLSMNFPYQAHTEAAARAAVHPVRHTTRGKNPSSAMPELVAVLARP